MNWKEEWRKEDCGSMSASTGKVTNPNPLSCHIHNGCVCDGDDKLRSMFTKKELKEFRNLLEKL